MEREELIKLRETFLGIAETIDEMIVLDDKEAAGETIDDKEVQLLMGKFMMSMIELQTMSNG